MKLASLLALGSFLSALGVLGVPIAEFDAKVAAGLRLVQTSDEKPAFWVTEEEKLNLLRKSINFFDLTETYHLEESMKAKKVKAIVERATYPAPSRQTAVNALLPSLSTTNMNSYLSKLTAFNNRYYKATTGLDASNYIYNTLSGFASGKSGVTISKFSHSWTQQSIIAKIAGSSPTAPIVILGAHEDSINLSNPTSGRAPGADDDGTGTVNLMEIFRVLVASNFKPTRNLEFHFYSGEEAGLLGSQAIAANYKSAGKSVYAMLNLDMTGYFKPGTTEAITLITDNTDSGLNTFVRSLVSSYSRLPAATSTCGYGCSDHAPGPVRVILPLSHSKVVASLSNDNPNIHSASDTTSVTGFSWSHSLEFAKVGLAFAYELSL
ncbi:aminopeptidase [Rhizoctonia solani]|nr:aminopeptidase [Rhizoctonia solani]